MVTGTLAEFVGQPEMRPFLVAAMVFAAGVLRGYTGFGFALAAVPMLALVIKPVVVVPMVLCLEVIAGLLILPSLRHEIHFRSVSWLATGALIATPLGLYGLATQSDGVMRLAIAVIVLLSAAMIGAGLQFQRRPGSRAALSVGVASGLLNGATAMGGPPVVLFYLGSQTTFQAGRASLVFYFLLIDGAALVMALLGGLVDLPLLTLVGLSIPSLAIGQMIGARLFRSELQRHYRQVAVCVLAAVGVAALLQSAGA